MMGLDHTRPVRDLLQFSPLALCQMMSRIQLPHGLQPLVRMAQVPFSMISRNMKRHPRQRLSDLQREERFLASRPK